MVVLVVVVVAVVVEEENFLYEIWVYYVLGLRVVRRKMMMLIQQAAGGCFMFKVGKIERGVEVDNDNTVVTIVKMIANVLLLLTIPMIIN